MKDSAYTLAYALVLGIVCSVLLTGAGQFTKPYREANAKEEKVRNILEVLGVPVPEKATAKELEAAVQERHIGDLTAYTAVGGAAANAVAVPFAGPGLWGPVEGLLALEPDMRTIRGITFHKQEETPGLGGEITANWFRRQFKGKRIVSSQGKPGIRIRRGKGASAPTEVDGITGATMTCDKVQAMLNEVIGKILKESQTNG